MEIQRCECITKEGTQCTRNHTHTCAETGTKFCTQHWKIRPTTCIVKEGAEPWDKLKLPVPNVSNGTRYIQKIRVALKKGPNPRKKGGEIYIYYLKHERALNYWKIGSTVRTADERLEEWAAIHHKSHEICLKKKFRVAVDVEFVEHLIHWYLKYCNLYRWACEETPNFHSEWALPPCETIEDGQSKGVVKRATRKHIEWFCEDYEGVIEPLVRKATSCLFK